MPAFNADDPASVQLELNAVPAGSPSAVVARQLIELLTAGDLAPGSRLPPERVLAERLGVGRSAVREAIASLEILGVVQVRPGSGTYLQGSASDLLPKTLSWGLMLAGRRTEELLELRSALEANAAELAATRISDGDLQSLSKYLDRMSASLDSPSDFIESDIRFHAVIAHASGNEVLADLLQTIRSLLHLWTERGLTTRQQAEDAYSEHRAVFEAIAARTGRKAGATMRRHMKTASQRVRTANLESS